MKIKINKPTKNTEAGNQTNETHFHLKLIIIAVVVGVASCGPALIMKDSRMDGWQKRQFKCITSAKS